MHVGFIGLGVMGKRMVRCLMEEGHKLTVHDLNRDAAAQLLALGAGWASTPKELAVQTEVVITSLPGPVEVEQVFFDPEEGVLAGLKAGRCFIDTTTNSPALSRRIAQACSDQAAEALDCPVTGRAPDMTIMAGGDAAVLERYKPLLLAMSRGVHYMGSAGTGMVAKGAHQYLLHAKFLLLSEALLIGAAGGIPPKTFLGLLEDVPAGQGMPADTVRDIVLPAQWQRVPDGPGPVWRWIKDVGCASETARAHDMDLPILKAVEWVLAEAKALGLGDLVNFADVQILEDDAGVKLRA